MGNVILKLGFMDEPIIDKDKDGVALTDAERKEYWEDVFDGGIPMSVEYVKSFLWPKWGERLGMPKPE